MIPREPFKHADQSVYCFINSHKPDRVEDLVIKLEHLQPIWHAYPTIIEQYIMMLIYLDFMINQRIKCKNRSVDSVLNLKADINFIHYSRSLTVHQNYELKWQDSQIYCVTKNLADPEAGLIERRKKQSQQNIIPMKYQKEAKKILA